MKIKILFLAASTALLSCTANLSAKDVQVGVRIVTKEQSVAFAQSSEAGMMHRAYKILATGDHDYQGRRVKAMKQVRVAADMLGLDLSGDLKDKEKQVLSDDKLREAKGLLQNVLGASVVKGQKRIEKHINGAINEINTALSIR